MFPDSRQRAERGGFPRPTARPVPDLSPYATKMRDSLLRATQAEKLTGAVCGRPFRWPFCTASWSLGPFGCEPRSCGLPARFDTLPSRPSSQGLGEHECFPRPIGVSHPVHCGRPWRRPRHGVHVRLGRGEPSARRAAPEQAARWHDTPTTVRGAPWLPRSSLSRRRG